MKQLMNTIRLLAMIVFASIAVYGQNSMELQGGFDYTSYYRGCCGVDYGGTVSADIGYKEHISLYYSNGVPFQPSSSGVVYPSAFEANNIRVISEYPTGSYNSGNFVVRRHKVTYVSGTQINFLPIFSVDDTSDTPDWNALKTWYNAADSSLGTVSHILKVQHFNGSSWVTTHVAGDYGNGNRGIRGKPNNVHVKVGAGGVASGQVFNYLSQVLKNDSADGQTNPKTWGNQPTVVVYYVTGAELGFNSGTSCVQTGNAFIYNSGSGTTVLNGQVYGYRIYGTVYEGVQQVNIVVPATSEWGASNRKLRVDTGAYSGSPTYQVNSTFCDPNDNQNTGFHYGIQQFVLNAFIGPWS